LHGKDLFCHLRLPNINRFYIRFYYFLWYALILMFRLNQVKNLS